MHYLPELPIDPERLLRDLDYRFEPSDPLFDPEEPTMPRPRRRRARPAAAAVAVLATLACGGSSRAPLQASDSILVQLEAGAAPPARSASSSDLPIVALTSLAPDGEAPLLRVPLQPGDEPAAVAAEVAAHPGVAFAEPVFIYQASKTPDDPRYKDLWGMTAIDAKDAWTKTTGSKDVVVAVVDDGVALTHPDLKPNLWVNPQEIAGNGADDDGDGFVDDVHGANLVDKNGDPSAVDAGDAPWHGSHVSGTIGAAGDNHTGVVGVNWKVSIMAVRGLGPQGGRSDDLARSIDYAVDHGARVINASWGGGGNSQVLSKAIERAGKKGVLFVVAAGNSGVAKPEYPANLAYANVLSVGALGPDGALASFSDRGALLAAPGVGILSTTAPGQYERYDGTSMAAPHVTGAAALLWAAHPEATLAQVTHALLSSGAKLDGAVHGSLDVARALAALDGAGGGAGALQLSRTALAFSARAGRVPRAQTVSIRADGGAARKWTAKADHAFIVLKDLEGQTPARVTIRVDPSKLSAGTHQGKVKFADENGDGPTLDVTVQVGGTQSLVVAGDSCELRDGELHAAAGAGCLVRSADGESASVRWILPGGEEVAGAQLYGQFVRPGRYELLVSSDEGEVDSLPVVIE